MHKLYSFILLLLFPHATSGMHTSSQEKRTVTYSNRINDQRRKKEEIRSLPNISKSVKSSGITKPHHTKKEKKEKFKFIYDEYTARRGEPKMLNIHCYECRQILIQYQKDGPGRLLRCYLDRIHGPEQLKNRQYEDFNVHTSPNLSCRNQNCRLIIGRPMIYRNENRPAYQLDNRCFYITESV